MNTIRRSALAGALAALVVLAGCSSDDPAAETTTVTTAPAAAPAETTTAGYDEAAHRRAFQAAYPGEDFSAYQEAVRSNCGLDGPTFVGLVAAAADEGKLPALKMGVEYMCPDRLPELEEVEARPTDETAQPEEPAGITDGVYVVGTDIQPGTYRSAGGDGRSCYWARLSNLTGEDDIIANNLTDGPSVVEILEGDAAFETQGCQPWVKQ